MGPPSHTSAPEGLRSFFDRSQIQNVIGHMGVGPITAWLCWDFANQDRLLVFAGVHMTLVALMGVAFRGWVGTRNKDGIPKLALPALVIAQGFGGSVLWIDIAAAADYRFALAAMIVAYACSAGTVITLGPVRALARAAFVCLLGPGLVACFVHGHYPMAGGTMFFMLVVAILGAEQMHQAYRELIHLRVEASRNAQEAEAKAQTLAQERTLLNDIISNLPAQVFWLDRSLRHLGCNPQHAWVHGCSSVDDVIGRTIEDLDSLSESELAQWKNDGEQVMVTGQPILHRQVTFPEGEDRHAEISRLPLRDHAGKVVGVVGMQIDRTEQHRMEQRLMNVSKLESIGQLAAGVAHEINTPIQFVGSNLAFLAEAFSDKTRVLTAAERLAAAVRRKEGFEAALANYERACEEADLDYLNQEIPQALDQTVNGTERIGEIVAAMKQLAHPGGRTLMPTDLNRLVHHAKTLTVNAWFDVADVVFDLDESLPEIPAMASRLSQVVISIIVNATQAISEADGRSIKGRICIRTRQTPQYVQVEISDNGPGIPPEIQGRIFDPFFTTKDVGKGSGQGLAIAHSIVVQQHRGRIELDSEPNRGTTFTISLPRTLAAASEPAPERSAYSVKGWGGKPALPETSWS